MKANFALTLSFTGIRLLHRAAGGWRFVGSVALDDPDLDGALAALRKTALALEPAGLRTKLVIPGTQIRYLTIDTEEVPEDRLAERAEAALEGATPYAVEELVFDVSPDGPRTHIAAVARETLAEAEAFAVEHRFSPISIVAIPEAEAFLGEPFFGATSFAKGLLRPHEQVEPDGIAIVELDAQEWPEGPVVAVEDSAPIADEVLAPPEPPAERAPEPQSAAVPEFKPVPDESPEASAEPRLPGTVDAGEIETTPLAQAGDAARNDATEEAADPEATRARPAGDEAAGEPPAPDVGFASRRRHDAGGAPKLGGVTRRFGPAAGQGVEAATDHEDTKDRTAEPASRQVDLALDDDVPNPPPSVIAAFLSRRQAQPGQREGAAASGRTEPRVTPALQGAAGDGSAPPKASAARPDPHTRPTEVPAMGLAAREARREIQAVRVPQPKSERQRMTVFGARQPEGDGAAVVGGKPRFLGLILTAMLLIFLAGVAAWATVFAEDGLSRFFAPRQPAAPAEEVAAAAEPDTEPALAEPETASVPQEVVTASLETELPPETETEVAPDMLAEPVEPPVFDPVEAEAQYAVTGIWTIPPDVPAPPGVVTLDDLYMTSIDPANLSFDAVALTPEEAERTDRAPLPFANPAPAGTEFELDERGLVVPTPEGSMSPDGILIHSGPPPDKPRNIPNRVEEASEDIDAAALRELSKFRPKPRPGDLVESTERRRLGGLSRSELAAYRPKLRPETVKKAAEEDETPTARAVPSSLRPSNRPGNFERIVARADRDAVRPANNPEPATQEASVAPRAVAPSIPSSTSVTREATVRNAINLRQMNLMGVYGSPSNRRALIRLSNGRYKKVKVGDRIDGGRVSAIGDSELSYVKGNRSYLLKMPRT